MFIFIFIAIISDKFAACNVQFFFVVDLLFCHFWTADATVCSPAYLRMHVRVQTPG